jgi:signal transduction histidine kinase
MDQNEKMNMDKAFEYAFAALNYATEQKLGDRVVEMNYRIGKLYVLKGDYQKALDHFEKNLRVGVNTSNSNFIARASINMANIYLAQGKYNSAIDRYLQALKIIEKGNDKELLYVNYLCLGIAYYYLKNYPMSLEFYGKCVDLEKQNGETAKLAYCYNAMGIIYKETGNYNKALELLERTQKIATQSGDSVILSHNLGNLGELYGLKGNKEKALEFLQEGISIQKHLKDDKGVGESYVHLGNLYLQSKESKEAISHFKNALDLGEKIGIADLIKDAHKGLANAYSLSNDFQKALEHERAYSLVKDSLFNSNSSMQVADMQTRYETEKKENENILLQKENNIKGLEIDKQKNQRNLLIVAFAILVLMGLLVYNSSRLKHRNKILAEKELRNMAVFQAQEKEKMQLSRELHDGLGPLLSLIKLNASSIKPEPGSEKILAEVKEIASQSIKEVRNISHALAPSLLQKQGLEPALRDFVSQINNSGSLHVELEYGILHKLNETTGINIYRIIQEALNNTIKHSGAAKAFVTIKVTNSELSLNIRDNGKGMDNESISSGNGLNNIYSRVDFLKGTITINSSNGKGTEFIISIPLSQTHNA